MTGAGNGSQWSIERVVETGGGEGGGGGGNIQLRPPSEGFETEGGMTWADWLVVGFCAALLVVLAVMLVLIFVGLLQP